MQTINKLIKENDTLAQVFMQESGSFEIEVAQNASFNAFFLMTGQKIDLHIKLQAPFASAHIKTIYLSSTDNDNHFSCEIIHNSEQTNSTQLIKGVATGISQTNFYGVIRIPFNSQKCEASQTHKALLLSPNAVIYATPELEIYADNVKCSHGSSVGNLEKDSLFYLLSRGIDEKTAREILIKAFLLADMPNDFEEPITQWMLKNE